MKQVVIENSIINSAFSEPTRHFRFDDEGITNEIVEAHRISHYFIPIAKPKKKEKQAQQLELDLGEWTSDRIEENKFINRVRDRVSFGEKALSHKPERLKQVWQTLNQISDEILMGEERVYGGRLHKLEPKELGLAIVPSAALADFSYYSLEEQEPERQLFLAVSQAIYIKHFQKPIFQLAVQRNKINLLVYEPSQEAILQWITH